MKHMRYTNVGGIAVSSRYTPGDEDLFSLCLGRARAGTINARAVAILTSRTRRGRF